MKKLILASASPRRVDLLKRIGYVPDAICPADIDETPGPKELSKPLAIRLAYEKAMKVAELYPTEVVLAADTVVCVGRRDIPKCLEEEQARDALNLLSGRRHKVYTAVTVTCEGQVRSKVGESAVKFKRLSTQEIEFFTASREWHGKAGGYALQGVASAFITWMQGSESNIIGLPLYETNNLLRSFGLVPHICIK
jgi:septum formation protein